MLKAATATMPQTGIQGMQGLGSSSASISSFGDAMVGMFSLSSPLVLEGGVPMPSALAERALGSGSEMHILHLMGSLWAFLKSRA